MTKPVLKFTAAALASLVLFVIAVGSAVPRPGTYTMSIVAADTLANVPAEVRSNFDGKWELTFAKGNIYHISKDGAVVVEGRFTSSAEQLALTDVKGVLACTQEPGMETGTYKWSHQQQQELTFTAIEDKCPGRLAVLTIHPWRKVK